MRYFIDIGSHDGQTLEEVVEWKCFDEIHAVEPMPRELHTLHERYDALGVKIWPYALTDHNGKVTIYGTNDLLEASIYPTKDDVDEGVRTEVDGLRATTFFEGLDLTVADQVYVDLNAEGAEIPILHDLIDSGMIHHITALLVSFDIDKVPGQAAEHTIMGYKLQAAGFNAWTAEYPDEPTHQLQIRAWLESVGLTK